MIRHMDEGIGRILKALKSSKVEKNTLVVFTSDNGRERYADTWPLVGKKMDLLEGDEFLFDLSKDERERANFGQRDPARLAAMRARYRDWEEGLPKYPDASFSVPASKADLAQPS